MTMPPSRPEDSEESRTMQAMRALRIGALTNRIVSALASLIAVAALATAVYQTKVSRDQAKAAVWPYLLVGNAGDQGYSRIVQNVGLGPAIIGAFEVEVNGHSVRSWREVADSMHIRLKGAQVFTTSFRPGVVLPVGARLDLLNLRDTADIRAFRSGLAGNTLSSYICYCSLYDDCWEVRGDIVKPNPLRACKVNESRAFLE